MEILENKEIHKNCIEKIEELHKDNQDMFKKYKDSLTKYHISNEIAIKLKLDLVNIENKYNFIEKQFNDLVEEKQKWITKDEHMTSFLHKNNFQKPDNLIDFIKKYRNHKCLCSCKPVKDLTEEDLIDNPVYKEQVMFVDILKYGEKERLRVEKENEDLRYDIDIGMKKRDKEINELKDKIILLENEIENHNKQILNDNLIFNNNVYMEKDIIVNNNSKDDIISEDNSSNENFIINEMVSSDNNNVIKLKDEIIELKNIIKLENEIKESKDIKIKELENKVQNIDDDKIDKPLKDKNVKKKFPYLNRDNNFRCSVIKYKDINSKSKRKAAKETMNELIHYHGVYKALKEEGKQIDEIVEYIMKNRNIKINSSTNKQTYKNKIIRSYNLYQKYNNKLDDIYFNLTSMARIYNNDFEEWTKILDNCIYDKENDNIESIEDDNNNILNFKDINNELTKNIEKLDIKDSKESKKYTDNSISENLENNILYECKNPNCDDDEVVNKNDYCNYCKKDVKKCKSCNVEFINDEIDVKICEDCNETMEMEGYYEDDY